MNSLELLSVRMSGVGMNIRLDLGQAAGLGQLRKSQEDLHLFQTTRGLIRRIMPSNNVNTAGKLICVLIKIS